MDKWFSRSRKEPTILHQTFKQFNETNGNHWKPLESKAVVEGCEVTQSGDGGKNRRRGGDSVWAILWSIGLGEMNRWVGLPVSFCQVQNNFFNRDPSSSHMLHSTDYRCLFFFSGFFLNSTGS